MEGGDAHDPHALSLDEKTQKKFALILGMEGLGDTVVKK
jgi:hypothetical protein